MFLVTSSIKVRPELSQQRVLMVYCMVNFKKRNVCLSVRLPFLQVKEDEIWYVTSLWQKEDLSSKIVTFNVIKGHNCSHSVMVIL